MMMRKKIKKMMKKMKHKMKKLIMKKFFHDNVRVLNTMEKILQSHIGTALTLFNAFRNDATSLLIEYLNSSHNPCFRQTFTRQSRGCVICEV
ncbi:MAG: hypothetical protein EZS28_024245 [Streblomastix strix]|uniref:Uncharacterized protein n=1 Tax=Streblomastix strix TaxID=222440 RepID=A0A5J4VCC8_9EUKA|nr:MAG: hypothetical protein EZS28_024245 [Streblomastix strix]